MIFIALGANLPSPRHGSPMATLEAALVMLEEHMVRIRRRSRWYESDPVPPSDQPPFINAVAECRTALSPGGLLDCLHGVERAFGRVRRERWEARMIDLDLLAYHDRVIGNPDGDPHETLILPHPNMHRRAFVLKPLAELAPDWRHPRLDQTVTALLAALPPGGRVEPLESAGGRP